MLPITDVMGNDLQDVDKYGITDLPKHQANACLLPVTTVKKEECRLLGCYALWLL
jgi:hypothetical protein